MVPVCIPQDPAHLLASLLGTLGLGERFQLPALSQEPQPSLEQAVLVPAGCPGLGDSLHSDTWVVPRYLW